MNARLRIVTPLLAAFAVAILATGGCACTPQSKQAATTATQVPAVSVESTPTHVTTPTASTGVTTPGKGTADRKALLDAARAKLGTSAEFYVHQLYSNGTQGIGDIESVTSHNRWFVAWTGGPTFKAVWTTPVGGSQAKSQAETAVSGLSPTLVSKMDWSVKKTTTTADATAMKSNLSSSARQWTKSLMSGKGEPYKVTSVKVAQDSSGKWWGVVGVQPTGDASNQYESIEFWAKASGTSWQGKAQDPEPPAPSTYFPSSVVSKLF